MSTIFKYRRRNSRAYSKPVIRNTNTRLAMSDGKWNSALRHEATLKTAPATDPSQTTTVPVLTQLATESHVDHQSVHTHSHVYTQTTHTDLGLGYTTAARTHAQHTSQPSHTYTRFYDEGFGVPAAWLQAGLRSFFGGLYDGVEHTGLFGSYTGPGRDCMRHNFESNTYQIMWIYHPLKDHFNNVKIQYEINKLITYKELWELQSIEHKVLLM